MAEASPKSTLTLAEAAIVSTICFGLFIVWSTQAVLSGFPEAKFSSSGDWITIAVEVALAAAALRYLHARRFDIGSLYPHPSVPGSLLGLGLFVLSWLAGVAATAPFAATQHELMTEFSYAEVSIASTVLFAMVNGVFEEVFLLGVLVRGLRPYGLSIAIGLPLLVRVLYHSYQGPLGMVWVLSFGLTFTLVYLGKKQLWPPVLAHILWDIVPVVAASS